MQVSAAASWLSIVLLIVLVLFVAAPIAGFLLWRRRGGSEGDSLVCGACGYPVRGMTALNCPECGADLREAGIVKPTRSSGGSVVMVIVLTIFSLMILMGLLSFVTFKATSSSGTSVTTSPAPAAPPAGSPPTPPTAPTPSP